MHRTRALLIISALALAAAIAIAGCATPSNNTTTTKPTTSTVPSTSSVSGTTTAGAKVYAAALKPVNHSGVVGEAVVILRGSTMYVQIAARGLVPGKLHAQHIHGFAGGKTSTCPPAVSGTVTQEPQAEKYYGPVLVALEPFPTASSSGTITYRANMPASSDVPTIPLLPLAGRAVVLHGLTVNGTYNPGTPVACGELRAMPPSMTPSGAATMPGGTGNSTGNSTGK